MSQGAIILTGGRSTRMGTAKAMLPFGPETMLERIVRTIGEVVPHEKIVVVGAERQPLPGLPDRVTLARDARPDRGPLEGLAAGLRALADRVDVVYATGCDVPLLVPAFVEQMFQHLRDKDIAVPKDGEFYHPLAAVYRVSVLESIERLLDADRLRPFFLFQEVPTREVPVDELRAVDPKLLSLANCNKIDDYRNALKQAGFAIE